VTKYKRMGRDMQQAWENNKCLPSFNGKSEGKKKI
jgi:hypothetical protein